MGSSSTYHLRGDALGALIARLVERYAVYAPVRVPSAGRYAQTDSILYKPVRRYEDIESRERSTYPMKEVLTPITQTLFYFTEDDFRESKPPARDRLIFARACDINSIKIQDQMFLKNGGVADPFYQRLRERAKFVLMECKEEFDGCFCCSVGANETDLHAMAFSFGDEEAWIEVRDEAFRDDFIDAEPSDHIIAFPQENALKVDYPAIDSLEMVTRLKSHPMWKEFDERCVACGACTVACGACTCFETADIVYAENGQAGERRRTCSSCMIDGFDAMAGGQSFRKKTSEKYRYKILHKVYGYDARFHTGPMCVGCGRCTARCPELISYPATLNKLSRAIEDIRREEEAAHV